MATPPQPKADVYDATDKILGRLASTVAKSLLQGKTIAVVNAEQSIISGNPKDIANKYKVRLSLQEKENPEHSPYWSRRPDMLVRRVIRGMLPYHKKPIGKAAYKRLKVYIGVPEDLKAATTIKLKARDPKTIYSGYIRVAELSKLLGYDK
jgi:large subunit ribosomal protein L13